MRLDEKSDDQQSYWNSCFWNQISKESIHFDFSLIANGVNFLVMLEKVHEIIKFNRIHPPLHKISHQFI